MTGPSVGLILPTAANTDDGQLDPSRTLAAARLAEAAGFDAVYVGDHIVHPRPLLESVVTLSTVAASTEQIALGPLVMLIALRPTILLARQLATLASFAPGRIRFGAGVGGEYPEEFEACGIPLSGRGARMEESLIELRSLIARETPDQIPFILAGWSEPALRRAARYADGWIGYLLAVESFVRRRRFLTQHREEAGETASFFTGMLLPTHIGVNGGDARIQAARAWAALTVSNATFPEGLFVAGEPDEVVEHLHRYWTAGCTELVLAPADQGNGYIEQLEVMGETVLPQVRLFS